MRSKRPFRHPISPAIFCATLGHGHDMLPNRSCRQRRPDAVTPWLRPALHARNSRTVFSTRPIYLAGMRSKRPPINPTVSCVKTGNYADMLSKTPRRPPRRHRSTTWLWVICSPSNSLSLTIPLLGKATAKGPLAIIVLAALVVFAVVMRLAGML